RLTILITKSDLDLAPYIHADESGKFQNDDVICLCVYLSSSEKWEAFLGKWHELLGRIGIPVIHMKTLYTDCKKIGLDVTQADAVLDHFIDIIRETIMVGFGVGLDARFYRA